MLLLDRHGAKDDAFGLVSEGVAPPAGKSPIVALPALEAALAQAKGAPVGVLVENNIKTADLAPFFGRVALIAIRFPSASDGRGFSLARQLRQRGYAGLLRASGPLFSDQFPQALACGFDEVEIPDANAARQPVEHWLAARERITLAYQSHNGLGDSIAARRRAAKPGN